jgi:hypothetical protein
MTTTDAPPAPFSITASTAPQPPPAPPAKTTTAPTSIKPANSAPSSSADANFVSPRINASYARLISTILTTINAENAQINSRTVKPAQLKPATNAQILPLLTTDSVSPVVISALAVRCAPKEMCALNVCQMLFICRQQCVTSVWTHCSTVRHARIKHSALAV